MKKTLEWVVRHPIPVLLVLILATGFFGYQIKNLKIDPDITKSLPQNIPAKRLYDRMGELFPTKEFIMVLYKSDSLFSVRSIQQMDALTGTLEALPEVYTVISPTNVKIIRSQDDGMEVKEALEELPVTAEDIAAFRERLYSNPIFIRHLIARDEKAAAILLLLHKDVDAKAFAGRLLQFLDEYNLSHGTNLAAAGRPIVNFYISEGVARDMRVFFNAGILLMLVLLFFIFRSFRGVVIPIVVVMASVIWTLGLMALVGSPMSHATGMMPILLMAIGIADSIHILTHYYQNAANAKDRKRLASETIQELWSPVVMTSLTTMVGFLALNTSNHEALMQLGIFTAFGVFVAMLWSLTFVPATLSMLRIKPRAGWRMEKSPMSRRMEGYGRRLIQNRNLLFGGIVAVTLLAGVGIIKLRVESSSIRQFPRNHPLRQVLEYVNDHFPGIQTFQIIVEGEAPGAIKQPEVLAKMDSLAQFARTLPHVGSVQSLADFIKILNRAMHGDDPKYERIPAPVERETGTFFVERNGREVAVEKTFEVPGAELIAQYLQLYEMSAKPDEFAQFVDFDYQNAKITVFLNDDRGSVLNNVDRQISRFIQQHFGDLRADITGMAKLLLVVRDMVVRGQTLSIIVSLLLVWLLTSFMFRSTLLGLYNAIPLFFGIFLNFAIMGWFNIPLNVETMVTSSVAIGVGIDYAIHFVHRYRQRILAGDDYEQAVPNTMSTAGVAILFNSITVAAGFALLVLSAFKGVRYMGLLLALTMITTAFGALTIIPVLFVKFKPAVLKRALGKRQI